MLCYMCIIILVFFYICSRKLTNLVILILFLTLPQVIDYDRNFILSHSKHLGPVHRVVIARPDVRGVRSFQKCQDSKQIGSMLY